MAHKNKLISKKFNRQLLLVLAPKKKRSIKNRKKATYFISNGDDQISKGNGAVELSNNNTQQMDVDQAMGIHVQPEIVMEILSKLPVRSLQRFKCVSTYWGALISDPYFRKKHLDHANNDQNSHKLLICQMPWEGHQWTFYCSSLSSDHVVEDEQKLDCPSTCKPVSSVVLSSLNGLVLLYISDGIDKQLFLWNPSTRESTVLPSPKSPLKDCVCGFGYDRSSDDYKILLMNLNATVSPNVSVSGEILALKSGSWRKIGKYPTGIRRVMGFWNCGTDFLPFVHGSFHWLGLSRNYTVVSLDISNEVYGEIPLLERMFIHSRNVEHGVSVLRGMLCLYSTCENILENTFKLWVLIDYGVKESWTLLLTIQGTDLFYSAKPKYMFVDGEVLLRCKHKPTCSAFRTSKEQFGYWPRSHFAKQGIVYTESLISPRLLV